MVDIYLLIKGQQQGPFTEDQVRQSLSEGLIPSDLPACHEGMTEWVSVQSLLEPSLEPPPLPSLPEVASGTDMYPEPSLQALSQMPPLPVVSAAQARPLLFEKFKWMAVGAGVIAMLGVGLLLFIFAISVEGNFLHASPSNAIKTALQQDALLGKEYKSARQSIYDSGATGDDALDQVAQLTRNLVSRMRAIPTNDCPADFQEAYMKHINCWSADADAIANHPHIRSGDEALLEGFLRGLGGDPTGGAFEVQDEIESYLNSTQERNLDINRSFEDVEACAVKYGVQPADYSTQ